MKLNGARVLLTGASSGIGRRLAQELTRRGAVLAISARRQEALERLADEIAGQGSPRPAVVPTDLARRGEAERLAEATVQALGQIDVLVNNAGGGVGAQIATLGDSDEARYAFEVNYWSPMALIHALVPGMRERREGAVVNVTSMAQVGTWPGFGAYAATKGAFAVATETLRMELTGVGIHVMEVIPGPVDTAVQGETRLAPGIERMLSRVPLGDPGVLAALIADGLERGRLRVIYPRRAAVGHVLPRVVRWDLRRAAARAFAELEPGERRELEARVIRTGSMGDEAAREARAAWEAARGRGERSHAT